MDGDFFLASGANRWNLLEAQKAQTIADLQAGGANYDQEACGDAIERLAVINQRQQAISGLHQQHVAALNPAPPPALPAEMEASKPISHMTWDDTYNMAIKTAKTPQEAEAIRAGFQKGMAEIIAHPTAGQRK